MNGSDIGESSLPQFLTPLKKCIILDDIVKSPYAALRFILRHCDVRTSTPHSSGCARLASGAFYFVVFIMTSK